MEKEIEKLPNVTVYDNTACFMVCVDGLQTIGFTSLGDAWRHIEWMYLVATQKFTVGKKTNTCKRMG